MTQNRKLKEDFIIGVWGIAPKGTPKYKKGEEVWNWINKHYISRESDAEMLLILLQEFNDYDNPIQMDAGYVRNKLIKVFEQKSNE